MFVSIFVMPTVGWRYLLGIAAIPLVTFFAACFVSILFCFWSHFEVCVCVDPKILHKFSETFVLSLDIYVQIPLAVVEISKIVWSIVFIIAPLFTSKRHTDIVFIMHQ